MIEVELPDGSIAEFPDGTAPDVIKGALQKRFGAPSAQGLPMAEAGTPVGVQTRPGPGMPADEMQAGLAEMSQKTLGAAPQQNANPERTDNYIRAEMEARKIDQMKGNGAFGDATDSINPMGWADEAFSTIAGAPLRMMRDGVGYDEAYTREQLMQEALKRNREERSPIASTIGKVAGDLVLPGAVSKAGWTMAGKTLPVVGKTLPLMTEAAGYGYVQGAGDAKQGEKTMGGLKGAAISAATAGLVSKAGDIGMGIANKVAKAPSSSKRLAVEAGDLYDLARKSGTVIQPQATNRLVQNIEVSAGRLNEKLHPQTTGIIEYLQGYKNKPMDVETFHEMRQIVSKAMDGASKVDNARLQAIKSFINRWAENPPTNAVPNGKQGLDLLRQADGIYTRSAKTSTIETLIDVANMRGAGKYTQSGEANAITQKAMSLYEKLLKNSDGFTDAEIALVRKIGAGETSGGVKRLIAKADPRGMISFGGGSTLGATLGGFVGGPIGSAVGAAGVPIAGKIAGRSVDKASIAAIRQLEEMVSSGNASPALSRAFNKLAKYAIPSALTATGLLSPRLLPSPQKAR